MERNFRLEAATTGASVHEAEQAFGCSERSPWEDDDIGMGIRSWVRTECPWRSWPLFGNASFEHMSLDIYPDSGSEFGQRVRERLRHEQMDARDGGLQVTRAGSAQHRLHMRNRRRGIRTPARRSLLGRRSRLQCRLVIRMFWLGFCSGSIHFGGTHQGRSSIIWQAQPLRSNSR
jgi:hypothetical protein